MMKFISLLFLFLAGLYIVRPVSAYEIPAFPDCQNPSGEIIANYNTGLHAIVGDPVMHEGKDTVYKLSDSAVLQCFCPADGNGIQTNWWQNLALTSEEIQALKNQGWYYIYDGSIWGLNPSFYLALNKPYYCGPATPTPTQSPLTPTPTPVSDPGNNGGSVSGGGAWSCSDPAPSAPKLNNLINLGNGKIRLIWSSVSPVSHYSLAYGLSNKNYIYGQTDIGNTTDFTVNGLALGQKYCFVVAAVNGCASSSFSNEMCSSSGMVLGLSATNHAPSYSGYLLLGLGCVILGLKLKKSPKI